MKLSSLFLIPSATMQACRWAAHLGLVVILGTSLSAHAQAPGKHVHGQAELNIAIESSSIQLMLESPLDNVLGFEHAPRSAAERQKVKDTRQQLAQGNRLFAIDPKAGCDTGKATVEMAVPDTDSKHHNHAHEHGDAELALDYRCSAADKAEFVYTKALFETFPRLQTLQVQIAGPDGQAGKTVSRTHPRINLAK